MIMDKIKNLFSLLDLQEVSSPKEPIKGKNILTTQRVIRITGTTTLLVGTYLVSSSQMITHKIINLFLVPGLSGIPSSSAESIGDQIIPTIQKIAQVGGAVTALVSLCIAGVSLMVSKRQEQRQESMSKIMNIAGGIAVIGFAASAVGFLTGSFMK